jgi:hypothetical protein
MTKADRLRSVREQIDNYQQTVLAIWALISICTWDSKAKALHRARRYSIGRRMTRIDTGADVTPDLVVQLSRSLGLIAEAKRTLPKNEEWWAGEIEQLRGYDGDLKGWWTDKEEISAHDLVLLLHQFHGPRFATYFDRQQRTDKRRLRRSLSIVEFGVTEQVGQRMFLCLRKGSLQDSVITESLTAGVPVPMERVLATYGAKAFYDAEPVTEYLMERIWTDFVMRAVAGKPRDTNGRYVTVPVSVPAIAEQFQDAYGSRGGEDRDVAYPKTSWIRNAMDKFVSIRLARKVDADNYVVLYREIRGDVLERFASIEPRKPRAAARRRRARHTDGRQGTLFPD